MCISPYLYTYYPYWFSSILVKITRINWDFLGFFACSSIKYFVRLGINKKESEKIMTNIRPQSKISIILQMISRPKGASISEMMQETVSSSARIRAMISELRMRHIRITTKVSQSDILSTVYVREDI